MAPERWLEGVAEAPSDIFSLGVTLLELLIGAPVSRLRLAPGGFKEDLAGLCAKVDPTEVSELLANMCAYHPAERPTAEQVVHRCESMVARCTGPTLRVWANQHAVPKPDQTDARDGTVVHEDPSSRETFDVGASAASPGSTVALSAPVETAAPGRAIRWKVWWVPLLVAGAALAWSNLSSNPTQFVDLPEERRSLPLDDLDQGRIPGPAAGSEVPEVQASTPARPVSAVGSPAALRDDNPLTPEVEPGLLVVHFDPQITAVSTRGRPITARRGVRLPLGVHDLEVRSGSELFRCTVQVSEITEVEVRPDDQGCVER